MGPDTAGARGEHYEVMFSLSLFLRRWRRREAYADRFDGLTERGSLIQTLAGRFCVSHTGRIRRKSDRGSVRLSPTLSLIFRN